MADIEGGEIVDLSGSTLTIIHQERQVKPEKFRGFLGKVLLALFLLVLLAVMCVTVVFVIKCKFTSSTPPPSYNETAHKVAAKKFSRRDGGSPTPDVFAFLRKVEAAYYTAHPDEVGWKPGATDDEIRATFRPYNPHPSAIKQSTDEAIRLRNELNSIFTAQNEGKLAQRELKAVYESRQFLRHLSSLPYEFNYYAGDFMLGPNIYNWQPFGILFICLENTIEKLKPRNLTEVVKVTALLEQYKSTILQYMQNMKLGVSTGMVRPIEACKAGFEAFKTNHRLIVQHNETGILYTGTATRVLSSKFLNEITAQMKTVWVQQHGKSITSSLREALVTYIGMPLVTLIRYIENEHMRHCVPSSVSSGLATLPLTHVYVDGVPDLSRPTDPRLPTGEVLNGSRTFESLLSFFTTSDITPNEVRGLGYAALAELKPQAVSIAKQVTGESNDTLAVQKFRAILSSRAMFFNRKPFSANESDDNAFVLCGNVQGAQAFCPERWNAYEMWKKSTENIYQSLRSKLQPLFYMNGIKKTNPACAVEVAPDFNPVSSWHSYQAYGCGRHFLPFFMDNYGPIYSDWSTTGHETEPGHHLEVFGYYENFADRNNDEITWLSMITYFPGFSEGWATYAESDLVAIDMNDLMTKYGMLQQQIIAALRLVIETGLHSYAMDRSAALKLFDEHVWDNTDFASKEITRYQSIQGHGVSYMIGRIAFVEAREYVKRELGAGFSFQEFHYQILYQGEVPLDYLQKYVHHYVGCVKGTIVTGCSNMKIPPISTSTIRRQQRRVSRPVIPGICTKNLYYLS